MWRIAQVADDDAIIEMFLALNREDPGPEPVEPEQMRHTLMTLRREPFRGRAVVLEVDSKTIGYALLISFWSNEIGGEICEIDELFVTSEHRSYGYGRSLFAALERGELWPGRPIALSLGTMPDNERARRLYQRLGFSMVGISMVKRLR